MKAYSLPLILTWVLAALFVALFGFLLLRGRRGKRPPASAPLRASDVSPGFITWHENHEERTANVNLKVEQILSRLKAGKKE